MNYSFETKLNEFYFEFGLGRKMVLSTSSSDRVSSRMMSVIQIDGLFYFQTDKKMRKFKQITENPYVALCIDNIQIEGVCEELGRPLDVPSFCEAYKECFPTSFELYSSLEDERLFSVKPDYIERWLYENGHPYFEVFDLETKEYRLTKYEL